MFRLVATREMYNNFDNISRKIIFSTAAHKVFFSCRSILPFLLLYCVIVRLFSVLAIFHAGPYFYIRFGRFSFVFLFLSLASGVFRFIYLFMVKMHLIYDCDGYSSFTGTNSFRIHIFWYAVCCVVVVVVFGGRVYFSVRVHFFLSFGCVYSLLSLLPVSCSFSGWLSNGGVAFLAFGHWKKMCFFFLSRARHFQPNRMKKAHTKTNNKSAKKSEPFLLSLRLFSEEIWQKCIRGSGASCLSAWHSAHANLMRICFIFICCRLFCRFFFSDSLSLSAVWLAFLFSLYICRVRLFKQIYDFRFFRRFFLLLFVCYIYKCFFFVLLLLCVLSL